MRVLELPRWKIIKKEVLFSLLIWLYIFEDITLYMSGPKIVDQLFRIGCIAVMMGILLVRQKNGIPIRVDDVTVYGFLLILSSVWQDLLSWNTVGIRIAINYVLPVFMYIFIINIWYYNKSVSKVILGIPMVYGVFASIQGILLFLINFFEIRIYSYTKYIPRKDNTYVFYDFFLGGYESWGSILGHPLGRVRSYFVEPTRFAAFLIIPLFLFWGYYRKKRQRIYLVGTLITFVALVFTMSRAGYIIFVGALVVGFFAKGSKRHAVKDPTRITKKDVRIFLVLPILAFLAVEVLLHGMVSLSEKYPDAQFLSVGIVDEETGEAHIFRSETFDFEYIVPKFIERPWGYGLSQTPHYGDYRNDLDTNLSSAILLWPMAGGLPGLVIMAAMLITLFFKYCLPALKSDDPLENAVGLIFVALALNSVNVGNWLNTDFLLVVAVMVALRRKSMD
jgi:hypothetical protein